jgi:hypothetical protein
MKEFHEKEERLAELYHQRYSYSSETSAKNKIKTPRGISLSKEEAEQILSKPLQLGNQEQIEALKVLEYLSITDFLYG